MSDTLDSLAQNRFLVVGTDKIGVRCSVGVEDEDVAKRHAAAWIKNGFEDVKVVDRGRRDTGYASQTPPASLSEAAVAGLGRSVTVAQIINYWLRVSRQVGSTGKVLKLWNSGAIA
jgi:hypothetical protein